jgi:hypothetical protein
MKRFWSCIAVFLASLGLDAYAQGLAPDCAAIHEANPAAPDGDYIISPGGKTFRVYCYDMAGSPREYLTLVNTGGNFNYALYGNVGGGPPANVTTHYMKIRLDPATLLVNVADQTFSSSAGFDCCIGPTPVVSMPYAHASSCDGWKDDGRANVDLTGLPFIVDDVFTLRGWFSAGSANSGVAFEPFDLAANFAVQSAIVNVTGGGGCGGTGPSFSAGAFNQFAGFDLQLAYTGGVDLDKDSCKKGGWEAFGVFKNQGDCVSWFATGGSNGPAL